LNCKLTDIKTNQSGVINDVIDNPLISKLFEFGLLPGASFKVLNIAPFNGPISILIEDTRIALRQKEAQFIIVDC
jgi:Fe2+ transport system protein FeoA